MNTVVYMMFRCLAAIILLPIMIFLLYTQPWFNKQEFGWKKIIAGMVILPCMGLMTFSHGWFNG